MPYIKIDAPIWIGFLPSFLPLFLFLSFSFFLSLLAIYDFHSVLFAAFFFRAEFKSRTESTGGKSNWSKTKWMYECRHDGRRQVRQLTSGLFISFGPIQLGLSSSTNSPPHKDNSPPIQNNMIPKKKNSTSTGITNKQRMGPSESLIQKIQGIKQNKKLTKLNRTKNKKTREK